MNFLFQECSMKVHPNIIVSNVELPEDESGSVYLVMISANEDINPQYFYPLKNEMFLSHSFSTHNSVRCQIFAGDDNRDSIRRLDSIKQLYFNKIDDKITDSIF